MEERLQQHRTYLLFLVVILQGFNNEHPNAKRAAIMKKRDWVSSLHLQLLGMRALTCVLPAHVHPLPSVMWALLDIAARGFLQPIASAIYSSGGCTGSDNSSLSLELTDR